MGREEQLLDVVAGWLAGLAEIRGFVMQSVSQPYNSLTALHHVCQYQFYLRQGNDVCA
jgi:hypothetical protein